MLDISVDIQTLALCSICNINSDSYFYRLAEQTRLLIAIVIGVCKETWWSVVQVKKGPMVICTGLFQE